VSADVTAEHPTWRARLAGAVPRPDLAVAAAAGLLMSIELAVLQARLDTGVPVVVPGMLVLALTATVGLRRRQPLVAYCVNGTSVLAYVLLGYPGDVYPWTNLVVLYTVAAHGSRVAALVALAIAPAGIGTYFLVTPATVQLVDFVFVIVPALAVWIAGQLTAARRAGLEHEAEERTRAADAVIAAERARMARELHDAVGHSLNVMVMHAAGARRLADRDPAAVIAALETVTSTGRDALAELDHLLGLLGRAEGDEPRVPARASSDLADLCDRLAGADLEVHLDIDGDDRRLPAAIDLALYRVAQEGLTNVVKHARARRVDVRLRVADGIELEVRDDGNGPSHEQRAGRGLTGATERIEALGGTLTFGPGGHGGSILTAVLPLERDA
jgi:signal transduction histidine kinase